jgi:4-hydroxybenzoate polyprenyltransferase
MSAFAIYVVWMFEFFWLRTNPAQFTEMIHVIKTVHHFVLGLTFFAFFVSFIREIVKDAEDIKGDGSVACKTLPLVVGIKNTCYIAAGIMIILIVATIFGQIYLWNSNFQYLFWYFMIVIQPLFLYTLAKLLKARKKEDFHFISNTLKIIKFAGIVSVQLIQLSY